MNRRALAQLVAGVAIAGICLYFFFRNTDFAQLWLALKQANYVWFLPAFAVAGGSLVFRVFRWKHLLYDAKRISFRGLWTPTSLGFLGNAVLPARAGEAMRIVSLSQRERVPLTTVLASLVMDRLFDLVAVALIVLLAFSVLPIDVTALDQFQERFPYTIDEIRLRMGVVMGLTAVGGFSVLLMLYYRRPQAERFLELTLFFLPHGPRERVIGLLEHFTDGMHVLKSGKRTAYCLWYTLLTWATQTLMFPLFALAVGIQDQMPLHAPLILMACASIAVLVPTPGYLGSYQLGMAIGLALVNSAIGADQPGVVEAFGILAWSGTFLPVVVIGLVTLAVEGVSLGTLQRTAIATQAQLEEEIEEEIEEVEERLRGDGDEHAERGGRTPGEGAEPPERR